MSNAKIAPTYILVDNRYIGGASDGSEVNPFVDVQSAIEYAKTLRARTGNNEHIIIQIMEGNSNTGTPYDGFTVNISNITLQGHPDNINLPRFETEADKNAGAIKGVFGTINVVEQSNVTIDGLHVSESHNIGIYVSGSDKLGKVPNQVYSNISVINNKVENTDSAGISVSGTRIFEDNPIDGEHYLENVLIQNNDVSLTNNTNANTEAISLGAGTNNFKIIDNIVHDTEQYGIDVKVGAKNGIISNNHIYNIEKFGIYLDSANRTIENVIIEHNLIHNVSNGIVLARETEDGETQVGGEASNINANLINIDIQNNTIFTTEAFGILVYRHINKDTFSGGEIDVNIQDNQIFDWGSLSKSSDAVRISKNLITDDGLGKDSEGNEIVKEPLDSLSINGLSIISGGKLNESLNIDSNNHLTAFVENTEKSDTAPPASAESGALNDPSSDNANQAISGAAGHHIIYGTSDHDTVKGSSNNDVMKGLAGNDILYGGDGEDTMRGHWGNDILFGGNGNDILLGDKGNDILIGDTTSNEFLKWNMSTAPNLIPQSGNDFMFGGDGKDILIGLSGDDVLRGGKGSDNLYGNKGSDRFVIHSPDLDGNVDIIKDFSLEDKDTLDLSYVVSGYDRLNDNIDDFVQITDDGTHSTVSINVNDENNGFSQIFILENTTGITDALALVESGNMIL